MNNNWIIVGFTGAGKSSALKMIKDFDQKKIFERYIDLDSSFEEVYQHPAEFIKEFGFDKFRLKELDLLKNELGKSKNQVISVGGGALHKESYLWLKSVGVKILAIDTSFEECWKRVVGDSKRPIGQLDKDEAMNLFHKRREYWLNADCLVHNNREHSFLAAQLKDWYSCQAAADD